MEQAEISKQIINLLKIANKQDILFECFCDIHIAFHQSDPDYEIDEDYDPELDIIDR